MTIKVAITGDQGFIGTNLTKYLRYSRPGWDVIEHLRPTFKAEADAEGTTDVRRRSEVKLLVARADLVIHLAARKGSWFCESDVKDTIAVNLMGTLNVAECCRMFQKPLIHFGTTAYYWSDDKYRLLDESAEMYPRTVYGHTKWAAERQLAEMDGLTYMVIRPVYAYGNVDGYAASRSESWPDVIVQEARKGRQDVLVTDLGGQYIKDYTHISDVCDATEQLARKFYFDHAIEEGSVVQVGAGGNHTFIDVVSSFMPPFPVYFDTLKDYKGNQAHSYDRLKSLLPGWGPKVDVLEYARKVRKEWAAV